MGSSRLVSRRLLPALRAATLVLLVGAIVAPRVSLALVTALGSGYRSVVICTGTGLARVTLSPSGEIEETPGAADVGPACVLVDPAGAALERAWRRTVYPSRHALAGPTPRAAQALPRALRPATSSRGPPPPRV